MPKEENSLERVRMPERRVQMLGEQLGRRLRGHTYLAFLEAKSIVLIEQLQCLLFPSGCSKMMIDDR